MIDNPRTGYRDQILALEPTDRWGFGDAAMGMAVALLAANIVGAIIMVGFGWADADSIPIWGFGVLQMPLWMVYLGVLVVAAAKGSGIVRAFGLSIRSFDAPAGLVVGIGCQLLVLPLLYLPIFELTGTDSTELSSPAKKLASNAQGSWSWILFGVLVGLAAPVVEELFFRGLLLRSLSKKGWGIGPAVVVSSLIFAGLHFQLLQLPGLLVFGLVLAVLTVTTGRLGPAVFAHIGFNATTVVVLYLDYRSRLG